MGKSADYPLLAPLASLTAYQDLLNRIREGDFIGGNLRGLGLPRAVRLALLAALHHDLQKPILLLTNRADRYRSDQSFRQACSARIAGYRQNGFYFAFANCSMPESKKLSRLIAF